MGGQGYNINKTDKFDYSKFKSQTVSYKDYQRGLSLRRFIKPDKQQS